MPCAAQVEAAGEAGFDYVVLDCEHGPVDGLELEHHLRAAAAAGVGTLVRVPGHDSPWIAAVLDSGAAGVIVPRVFEVASARAAVSAAHYPPHGRRGLSLSTRAGRHGASDLADHLARAAEQTAVVIQIEDAEALPRLDELLSVEGVDGVLIGANDLSMSLGHPGAAGHPEVAAAIESILQAAARHGRAVMVIASNPVDARRFRERGAAAILYVGSQLLLEALRTAAGDRPAERVPGPEPLLLVPGTGCDHDLWSDVISAVAEVSMASAVRIDLDDSIEGMADSILAAAPPRFALAGHSQGAAVCLEIVRRAPERVTRLALLNASARPGSPAQLARWTEQRARLEADGSAEAVVEELVSASVGGGRSALAGRLRAMAERIGRDGLRRELVAQSARPDARAGLAAIRCPTLVISGGRDRVCPPELQEELAAAIPGARLAVLERCGHVAPLEDPGAVSALLREWLADAGERS